MSYTGSEWNTTKDINKKIVNFLQRHPGEFISTQTFVTEFDNIHSWHTIHDRLDFLEENKIIKKQIIPIGGDRVLNQWQLLTDGNIKFKKLQEKDKND